MFKTAFSLAALLSAVSSAMAADLPSRVAPPVYVPPAALFSWTGFYGGVNAGYTETSQNNVSLTPRGAPLPGAAAVGVPAGFQNGILAGLQSLGGLPFSSSQKRSGFIGGGQIGYNYQFANSVVVGLETDIQGLSNSNTSSTINAIPTLGGGLAGAAVAPFLQTQSTISRRIDYIGTVRGRLGYSFDHLLVYGTGGLAYGETKLGYDLSFPVLNGLLAAVPGGGSINGSNSSSKTSVGYTVGGGVEYAFNNHWSVKAEGLYYDLGRQSVTTNVVARVPLAGFTRTETVTASARNEGFIARAGLNYRFSADPVPVVARY